MKKIVDRSVKLWCDILKETSNDQLVFVRNLRFSATSNILSIKSRRPIETLVNKILNPKKFDSPTTSYRIRNKKQRGRAEYKILFDCEVRLVGVFISA